MVQHGRCRYCWIHNVFIFGLFVRLTMLFQNDIKWRSNGSIWQMSAILWIIMLKIKIIIDWFAGIYIREIISHANIKVALQYCWPNSSIDIQVHVSDLK